MKDEFLLEMGICKLPSLGEFFFGRFIQPITYDSLLKGYKEHWLLRVGWCREEMVVLGDSSGVDGCV